MPAEWRGNRRRTARSRVIIRVSWEEEYTLTLVVLLVSQDGGGSDGSLGECLPAGSSSDRASCGGGVEEDARSHCEGWWWCLRREGSRFGLGIGVD